MTTQQQERVRELVDTGIRNRLGNPTYAATPLTAAYRTLLGYDGTSIDDAVELAWTPTGPSKAQIRQRIEFRRATPHLLHPVAHSGQAAA